MSVLNIMRVREMYVKVKTIYVNSKFTIPLVEKELVVVPKKTMVWDGRLKRHYQYQHGVDTWEYLLQWWHHNGQLRGNFNYKDGENHGLCESYYSNGTPEHKAMYDMGTTIWEKF